MNRRHHLRKIHSQHDNAPDQPNEAPLSTLCTGEKGIVIGVTGGRGILERMTSLGFVPGTEVIILQNYRHGPIIVRSHDARIALGRGVASRIQMRRSGT